MNTRTLARARFSRTSAEGGGGGNPPATDPPAGAPPKVDDKPQAPVEATDEHGVGLGFPKDTKTDDMTDAQRANYWRNQAKVVQKRVPGNLSELEEAARKWAEFQQSQQTPSEQALQKVARETEDRVRKEAAEDSVISLMRVTLSSRGKESTEVDELVEPVNPAKFLTQEGKVDTGKVTAFLDKLAPTSSGGGGNGGQGRGYGQPPASRAEAGHLEAQRRFAAKKPPVVA